MGKTKAAQSNNSADRQSSAALQEASIQLLKKGFLPNLLAGTENELLDSALHACLQLLEKKDIGTRLKSLEELESMFLRQDAEQLLLVAPYWTRMFCRMLTSPDYRLRMACLAPHTSLVTKLKDKFSPYFKHVSGAWYCAQVDSHPSVAKQAVLSMQSCFPSKYTAFVKKFFPAILMHAKMMVLGNYNTKSVDRKEQPASMPPHMALKQTTAGGLANVGSTESKDEIRERRQRELYAGLKALRNLFDDCCSDTTATMPDDNFDGKAAFSELLEENFEQLVKDVATHDSNIKFVLFDFLSTLWINDIPIPATHAKFFAMLLDSLEGLSANYAGSDADAVAMGPLISSAWECLAVILHKQPDLLHAYLASSGKPSKSSRAVGSASRYDRVCRSLVKLVTNGGYGYAAKVFPNLLPIIAALPIADIQTVDFWSQLTDAFRNGLTQNNCRIVPAEAVAVVQAFLEIGEHIISRVSASTNTNEQHQVTGSVVAQCHTALLGDLLFRATSFGMIARNSQIFEVIARMVARWTAGAAGRDNKEASRAYGRVFTSTFWPLLEERLAGLYESMQLEERRRKLRAAAAATAETGDGSAAPDSALAGGDTVVKDQFFAERHAVFIQNLFASTISNEADTNSAAHRMLILMATGYVSTLTQVDMFTIEIASTHALHSSNKTGESFHALSRSKQLTKNHFSLLSIIMGIQTGGENGTRPFEQAVVTALMRVCRMESHSHATTVAVADADAQLVIFLLRRLAVPVDYVAPLIVQLVRKRCTMTASDDTACETILCEILSHCDVNDFLTIREALSQSGVPISSSSKTQTKMCEELSRLIADACVETRHEPGDGDISLRSKAGNSVSQLRSVMASCLRQFSSASNSKPDDYENITKQLDFVLAITDAVISRLENKQSSFSGVRTVLSDCFFPFISVGETTSVAKCDSVKMQQVQLKSRQLCGRLVVDLYVKAFVFSSTTTGEDADLPSNIFNDCLFDPAIPRQKGGSTSLLDNNFVFLLAQRMTELVQSLLNDLRCRLSPHSARRLELVVTMFSNVIKQRSTLPNADQLLYEMLSDKKRDAAASDSMPNNLSRACLIMSNQCGNDFSISELLEKQILPVAEAASLPSVENLQQMLLAAVVRVHCLNCCLDTDAVDETNVEDFRTLKTSALRTLLIGFCIENAAVLQSERLWRWIGASSTAGNEVERQDANEFSKFQQVCKLAAERFCRSADADTFDHQKATLPVKSDDVTDWRFSLTNRVHAIRRYAASLRRMRLLAASVPNKKSADAEDELLDRIINEFLTTFVAGGDNQLITIEALEALTNELIGSLEQCCNALAASNNTVVGGDNKVTFACYAFNALYELFSECAHLRAMIVEGVAGTKSSAVCAWSTIEQQYGEQYDVFKLWLVELTEFYGPRITTLLLNFSAKYFAPLRSIEKLMMPSTVNAAAGDSGFNHLTSVLYRSMLGASLCRLLSAVQACNELEINKLYKLGPADSKKNDLWWSKTVSHLCRCVFEHVRCFFGAVVLPQLIELREVTIIVRGGGKTKSGDDASVQITTTTSAASDDVGDDNLLETDENHAGVASNKTKQRKLSSSAAAEQQQQATRIELPSIIHSIWDAYNDDISRGVVVESDETEKQWSLEYYLLSWRALLRACDNDPSLSAKLAEVIERELTRTTLDRLFAVLLAAHETLDEYRQYFSTLGGVLQLFNRWYVFADTGTPTTNSHNNSTPPSLEKQLHILAFVLIVEIFRFYPAITRSWFANTLGTAGSDSSASSSATQQFNVSNNSNSTAVKQIHREVLDCTRQYVSPILLREEMSLLKAYARGEVRSGKQQQQLSRSTSDDAEAMMPSVSSVADDEFERVTLAANARARRISTASVKTAAMLDAADDQDGFQKKFSLSVRENVREIVATYLVEQMRITTTIVVPDDFPLSQPAVQANGVGIDDAKIRAWLLGLVSYFRQYNGSILDGILLWKRNIEKHFQGIEECAICLSIVHGQNGSLPRTPCYKCGKRYHPYCLYRWFKEQEKPTCPLCRTTFTRRRHQQLLSER